MRFGGLVAVNNFCLDLAAHDLVGVIGPNGAGKTTIFNMITGVYCPTSGSVMLASEELKGKDPATITKKGIARTFQNIRLFKDLTVLDNVKLACHFRCNYNMFQGIFRTKKFHTEEKRILDEAIALLKIFGLDSKKSGSLKIYLMGNSDGLKLLAPLPLSQVFFC
ncbi:MAG: ATP-binding cassette domain-containing protein [Bacteriovoracaceae bacterium]